MTDHTPSDGITNDAVPPDIQVLKDLDPLNPHSLDTPFQRARFDDMFAKITAEKTDTSYEIDAQPNGSTAALANRRGLRQRRLITTTSIAASVVLVAVLTLIAIFVPKPATASAAELLRTASSSAAHLEYTSTELAASQSQYQKLSITKLFTDHGYRYSITKDRTTTIDGSGQSEIDTHYRPVHFINPYDEQRWERAGKPHLNGMGISRKERVPSTFSIGDKTWPTIDANAHLDVPPPVLNARLRQLNPAESEFTSALRLLLVPGMPNSARSALYGSMAALKGSHVVGRKSKGPLGDEVALSRPDGVSVTFDTGTGQILHATNIFGKGSIVDVAAAGIINCMDPVDAAGPNEIYIGCATGGYVAHNIVWSNWGAPKAHGTATVSINDCDPSCADGKVHNYPVQVVMSDLRDCGYNLRLYQKLTINYPPGTNPPGIEHDRDEYAFSCTPGG